jgi:hypothetical protein
MVARLLRFVLWSFVFVLRCTWSALIWVPSFSRHAAGGCSGRGVGLAAGVVDMYGSRVLGHCVVVLGELPLQGWSLRHGETLAEYKCGGAAGLLLCAVVCTARTTVLVPGMWSRLQQCPLPRWSHHGRGTEWAGHLYWQLGMGSDVARE